MDLSWAKNALKVFGVLLLGALIQTTFAGDMRLHDVAPDFMILLAVCAGFIGGPDQGAVVGFAAGLMGDLFLQGTPFGLTALAGCLAAFAVGWVTVTFLQPRLLLAPAAAAAGTALGVVLFVMIGYMVGQAQLVAPGKRWFAGVVIVEAFYAALFALPATVLMGWALRVPARASTSLGQGPLAGVTDLASRRRAPVAPSRRRRRARAGVR
jgi:rod shape-determining protein MreD